MKVKLLSALCALACGGFASSAMAGCGDLPTTTAANNPFTCTAEIDVYLTGATAPDNFLESTMTGWLNGVAGTDWFKFVDSVNGAQQRAFVGRIKTAAQGAAAAGVPANIQGKSIRFIKRSTGGSVIGVIPVARSELLETLNVGNQAACVAGGLGTIASPYRCPLVPASRVSDFGVSDVAPFMFKSPYNVEFGQGQLSAAETSAMTIKAANVLMMGMVATRHVPATAHLGRALYGSLLNGDIQDWGSATAQAGVAISPPAGGNVVVCRRVPGSGTQTSYNWLFSNFPCTEGNIAQSGTKAPARMNDSAGYDPDGDTLPGLPGEDGLTSASAFTIDPTAGYTVIENSTSGNVRDCLEKAAEGGTHTFRDEQNRFFRVNFGTGGYGAVGVLSVDSINSNGKSASSAATGSPACNTTGCPSVTGWSFRSLDGAGELVDTANTTSTLTLVQSGNGVHPTKANLTSGKYDFGVELTLQYKTTTFNAFPVDKRNFITNFIARVGSPDGNTNAWVAALPPATAGVNTALGKRGGLAGGGNMCAPLRF